jgi:carboxymethylenebutenolidase
MYVEDIKMQTVDYYMSTSSPWAYLGSKLFTELANSSKAKVNVYPVNFGQIFSVSGGLPLPKRAPQRQAYRLMELQRWKTKRNSPMYTEPTNFPSTNPISSLAIIAARENGNDALALSNAVLAALWENDRNIDDEEVIKAICMENKLDGEAIIASAVMPETAKQFEVNTQKAIEQGVFGAPTYLIEGELFWGQDRLDFVSEKLGL